ncbi:unnamed protein product, partial [Polarella glacialis]
MVFLAYPSSQICFGSYPAFAAGTSRSCGSQQGESCSAGARLAQGGIVLQRLLGLGRTPNEGEVSEILSAELENWRVNPRHATTILSSLARLQLPRTATYVLASMRARSLEANVFHYNAAISACEKAQQWQLAL